MQLSLKRCKQCVYFLLFNPFHDAFLSSFELGGEKKTKGAALTFVSHFFAAFLLLVSDGLSDCSKFTMHCFHVASVSFRRITNMIWMHVPLPPIVSLSTFLYA